MIHSESIKFSLLLALRILLKLPTLQGKKFQVSQPLMMKLILTEPECVAMIIHILLSTNVYDAYHSSSLVHDDELIERGTIETIKYYYFIFASVVTSN